MQIIISCNIPMISWFLTRLTRHYRQLSYFDKIIWLMCWNLCLLLNDMNEDWNTHFATIFKCTLFNITDQHISEPFDWRCHRVHRPPYLRHRSKHDSYGEYWSCWFEDFQRLYSVCMFRVDYSWQCRPRCSEISNQRFRKYFLNSIFVSKPYVPKKPRRDPSNRRLHEHGIYISHCQESNPQPVLSQAGADTTRPLWQDIQTISISLAFYLILLYIHHTIDVSQK